MVRGTVSSDWPVEAPASAVWGAYRGLELPHLITKLLPDAVGVTEVVEGDGGVGTLIKLKYAPGELPGPGYWLDRYTIDDNEARVKEKVMVEGGFLTVGFELYRMRFEIVENGEASSVIRSTIEYEIANENAAKASLVSITPWNAIAEAVGKYVEDKYKA